MVPTMGLLNVFMVLEKVKEKVNRLGDVDLDNLMPYKCTRDHDHVILEGSTKGIGSRTRNAEAYPELMASVIADGITAREEGDQCFYTARELMDDVLEIDPIEMDATDPANIDDIYQHLSLIHN